jgi:hypothetical protein
MGGWIAGLQKHQEILAAFASKQVQKGESCFSEESPSVLFWTFSQTPDHDF